MKYNIIGITALMVIYNALFAYIIVRFTFGTVRLVLLALVALDYIIIFYFVVGIANELRLSRARKKAMR